MPTRYPGTPSETRALNAFIKLQRASETVAARLQDSLAGSGLTLAQLGVLEALLHLGPMNQRRLGEKLLRSKANVTTVLANLEAEGLILRKRDADDRRAFEVKLSASGRRRIEKVFPSHARRIEELMGGLTPDEQDQLGNLCRSLGLHAAADRNETEGTDE